jgi:hypothetical protein
MARAFNTEWLEEQETRNALRYVVKGTPLANLDSLLAKLRTPSPDHRMPDRMRKIVCDDLARIVQERRAEGQTEP